MDEIRGPTTRQANKVFLLTAMLFLLSSIFRQSKIRPWAQHRFHLMVISILHPQLRPGPPPVTSSTLQVIFLPAFMYSTISFANSLLRWPSC